MSKRPLIVIALFLLPAFPAKAQRASTPYKQPSQWIGTINAELTSDRVFGLVTLDAVGGYLDSKPNSAPDGIVDWEFVLIGLTSQPPPLSGAATLRMTEGGNGYLDFLEIIPTSGQPVIIRTKTSTASPQRPSTPVITVCAIFRLYPQLKQFRSHQETATEFFGQFNSPQRTQALTQFCS